MSQDVKLHIFQQIHTPSGNQLTGSYFCSVACYDTLTSFTALVRTRFNPYFGWCYCLCTYVSYTGWQSRD